jgi:hypothetical protein
MRTFHLTKDIPVGAGKSRNTFTVGLNTDKLLPHDRVRPVDSMDRFVIQDGPWVGENGYDYAVMYVSSDTEASWPEEFGKMGTEFRFCGRSYISEKSDDWGPAPSYSERFPDWKAELDKL